MSSPIQWDKSRSISPAPLSTTPKDFALETVQEDDGPITIRCQCGPECMLECCAGRRSRRSVRSVRSPLSVNSDDSNEHTPLLGVKRVSSLLGHPLILFFSPYTTKSLSLSFSPPPPPHTHTQNMSVGGESIHCACHVKQPDTTSRKARNKLLLACVLALLFMIGEVVGMWGGWVIMDSYTPFFPFIIPPPHPISLPFPFPLSPSLPSSSCLPPSSLSNRRISIGQSGHPDGCCSHAL